MRNVLLISYYFPPSGGPGVQRVLKFTRYLPDYGYRPLVLTVPETAAFPVRDPALMAEVPAEAKVFRSPIREFYRLYEFMAGSPTESPPPNLAVSAPAGGGWRRRLLSRVRAALFVPDGRVGWLASGTHMGLEVCRSEEVALIYASGPPFTAHWIARRIGEATGLPLVLDFRDPWIGAPFYPPRPGLARRLDRRLEGRCLGSARAVVTVNQDIREDLLARYPKLAAERVHVVPNGYDPDDFAGRTRHPDRSWTLAYTGTLPASLLPSGLLPALDRLHDEEPGLEDDLRIRLAGVVDPSVVETLRGHPLGRGVTFEGYLPHRDSIQVLLDSHLLLLLVEPGPRARGILTGKLFEYAASGVPILALIPEGEAADLIRRTRTGRVVSGGDPAAIAAALREALQAHREGRRPFGEPDAEAVAEYGRPRLTAHLARIFDGILVNGR